MIHHRTEAKVASEPAAGSRDALRDLLEAGRRREWDRQVRLLRGGAWKDRKKAAQALAGRGAEGVEPLCQALGDRDDRVRIAAVNSLEAIGDPRAMPALMAALKGTLAGGSGRRHVTLRHVLLLLSVIGPLGSTLLVRRLPDSPWSFLFVVFPLGLLVFTYLLDRMNHAHFQQACVEALATLAAREPAPALGGLLPDLKALAADQLQSGDIRRALAEATARIDALTVEGRHLPIAASAPDLDRAQLPVSASDSRTDAEALPRVSA